MATYKVLQDIEAEDKLLGPLTLKQFIFAIIAVALGFINFKLATAGALGVVRWPLMLVFVLPMALFGFLAAPIGKDQSNEIWLIARLRFMFKPRKRIWNQDGLSELVTITVPKKIEKIYTDGLSQTEVKSRLKALANTLDSRGWAVKNVPINLYAQPGFLLGGDGTDRLVDLNPATTPSRSLDVDATDILDEANNSTAKNLSRMVEQSEQSHRQQLLDRMQTLAKSVSAPQTPVDNSALTANANPIVVPDVAVTPTGTIPQAATPTLAAPIPSSADDDVIDAKEEAEFLKKVHEFKSQQPVYNNHLKTIQPIRNDGDFPAQATAATQITESPFQLPAQGPDKTKTEQQNPAILELARNNDLSIDALSRQAEKASKDDNREVVISLR